MLTQSEIENITAAADAYKLCNGIVIGTRAVPDCPDSLKSTPSRMIVHSIPSTLAPMPFPKALFNLAYESAPLFNKLVDAISRDHTFLIENLKAAAAADSFTAKLLNIFETVVAEGIRQPNYLGIHRSDYLLHVNEANDANTRPTLALQQVEINTIASSFGCLTTKTHQFHEYLLSRFPKLQQFAEEGLRELAAKYNVETREKGELPASESMTQIPLAIAKAHNIVVEQFANRETKPWCVLFVIQNGERNIADQKHIEHALLSTHRIPVIRASLGEIAQRATIDPESNLLVLDNEFSVSVVYFRAGYTPTDYHSDKEWDARLLLERSSAIKCPSIAYHLVGTKKIQQVFSNRSVLERFLPGDKAAHDTLMCCFTELYSLEFDAETEPVEQIELSKKAIADAIRQPHDYVLKPQREGGGNLIYGAKMQEMLHDLSADDRRQYILMKRIKPPAIRALIHANGEFAVGDCVSELGVFCVYLGNGDSAVINSASGHLLRTKLENVEDGGVAAGVAMMDSVYV